MPDDVSAPLVPERIRSRTFSTVRRGADPSEVQAFLRRVATELATANERVADLQRQLDMIRTAPAEPAPDPLDPSTLTRILGEETTRVLDAAQAAAAEIRARAEEGVARMLRDAREETAAMREQAESLLAERTEHAEAEAALILARAEAERERAEVESAHAIEEAKREGRALVVQAQQHRTRLLDDLDQRQSQMREQIAQLQAGRDRLMAAYESVRESVSSATRELQGAFPTAEQITALETATDVAIEPIEPPAITTTDEPAADPGADAATPGVPEFVTVTDLAPAAPASTPTSTSTPSVVVLGAAPADTVDADTGAAVTTPEVAVDTASDEPTTPARGSIPDLPTPDVADVEPERPVPSAPEVQTPAGPIRSAALPTSLREPAGRDDASKAAPKPTTTTAPASVDAANDTPADAPKDAAKASASSAPSGTPTARPSTSVRVVRTSSGKVADVFERLRKEGAEAAEAEADAGAKEREQHKGERGGSDATTSADAEPAASAPRGRGGAESDATSPDSDDVAQQTIVKRDDVVSHAQAALSRRIKRELSDQQNEMLAAISSVRGTVTTHDILPMTEDHLERFDNLALVALQDAASAGAELGRGRRSGAHSSVADLASALASSVVMPLRIRLEAAITESGRDRDALAKSIRSVFREWKADIDDVVALQIATAVNRGLLDTVPKGTSVQWILAEGDTPSPDCVENAGAGSIPCGDAFPSGHVVPPGAIGCRCIVLHLD